LTAIFVAALVLRLAWIATLDGSLTWDDEREFAQVARHLAAGDGFVSSSYRANPILPIYLAGSFRLFGESLFAARVGQAVLSALTCVLVGLIAWRTLGPAVGALSALLVAIYPPHVYLAGVFYVECLFTFAVAVSLYLVLKALDDPDGVAWWLLAGASVGIAVLTRSVFLAYVPFLMLAVLYAGWARPWSAVRACGVLALGAALVIAPWSLRNFRVYGRPVLVSSGFGTKLWQGNNEMTLGDADDRELYWTKAEWTERAQGLDESSRRALAERYAEIDARVAAVEARVGDRYLATDIVLMPIAARYIAEHPARTTSLFVKKLATLFAPFSKTLTENRYTAWTYKLIAGLSYFPLLLLAVAGLWLARHEDRRLALLYALLGSIVVAYGALNTCTRFRLPLDPFLIIFSAYALVRLHDAWLGPGSSARGRLA
jgi:4-amino-4-deoxy-L-arabinose transferase-like glycosyltransferase